VPSLAQHVLEYSRGQRLLRAGHRVGVAVSGGADSVALLRLLLELRSELGIVLAVVHFNHKLRGAEAEEDEHFVAELARLHELTLHHASGDVAAHALKRHVGLEAAGREMRYGYFWKLLQTDLDRIATAHTLDDQAETVLLRMVRGAGTRGLAGIYPQSTWQSALINQPRCGTIIRPLLAIRRPRLEAYLGELGQPWREDMSNRDLRHARNRVRHGILPRLERNLNPAVREVLAESAEIARGEEEYWQAEVARALPAIWQTAGGLKVGSLLALPLALQRRMVRAAAESLGLRLEFRHVEEVLKLAEENSGSSIALPGGWKVTRSHSAMQFCSAAVKPKAGDYEYPLRVPGSAEVPEANLRLEALLVAASGQTAAGALLDAAQLPRELRVRNWRAGDRFWAAHSRRPKKIKELLQERHISGDERKLWPVVVSGDEVVWMRGFLASSQLRPPSGAPEAVIIREVTPSAE